MKELTQDYLKECFDYNRHTGCLAWSKRPSSHFKAQRSMAAFNNKYPGVIAGWVDEDSANKYVRCHVLGKSMYAHNLIWIIHNGSITNGIIDHIDGNTLNNKIENLRNISQSENTKNARKRKDNRTGATGVMWHKANKKWVVTVGVFGKNKYFGSFDSFEFAEFLASEIHEHLRYSNRHGI